VDGQIIGSIGCRRAAKADYLLKRRLGRALSSGMRRVFRRRAREKRKLGLQMNVLFPGYLLPGNLTVFTTGRVGRLEARLERELQVVKSVHNL
jgi:hypothetical protein